MVLSCLSQLHFIYLVRSTKWILAGLGSVFIIMFLLVSCGVFFPYSGNPDSPRPKRVFLQVQHTQIEAQTCTRKPMHLFCFSLSHPPPCSIRRGPSTISRARWRAGTRACGLIVLTTQPYSTSHPASPSSTTAFAPAAERTDPSVVTPGSCQWSSLASQ